MISCISLAKELISKEIFALESLLARIGPEFERAVSCLHEGRGKVITSGLGKVRNYRRQDFGDPFEYRHAVDFHSPGRSNAR